MLYAPTQLNGVTSGLLLTYYNNNWGTVCDDFSASELKNIAIVACRALGYAGGTEYDADGARSGYPIVADNSVNTGSGSCTGNEALLNECPGLRFGAHNCVHEEDIGVRCVDTNPPPSPPPPSPPPGFLNLHYEQAYSSVNRHGTTKFAWTKLKWLNPYLLQIDASDITYATWPSGSDLTSSILPYTVASGQGCAGGGSTTGEGLIDLRGTPYVIAGVSDTPCYQTSSGTTTSTCFQWEASGWKAAVSVTCSHGNQRCVIRCGGNCGTCKPMNNILQLAWA